MCAIAYSLPGPFSNDRRNIPRLQSMELQVEKSVVIMVTRVFDPSHATEIRSRLPSSACDQSMTALAVLAAAAEIPAV